MVPSMERSEYMYELRNIADNIVRERLQHAEMHPTAQTYPTTDVTSCDPATPCPQSPTTPCPECPGNIGTLGQPAASEVFEPSVEPHSAEQAKNSPSTEVHVGPAFHIPMT
jgi:hypothetical protein